jgi:hypothetical protein
MTNITTYTQISVPYFYIVRHIPSGLRYAGSKRGKGSNPATLLQPNGYFTSSSMIHRLIEQDRLCSFEVLCTVSGAELGELSAYEYETKFLNDNDCANSTGWLNQHNNTGRFEMHSPKAREYMLATTGYEYPMQNPATQATAVANNLVKYGVRYPTMLPAFIEHTKQVLLDRTGYENALADPNVRERNKQIMQDKWGVTNPMQSDMITQARNEKMLSERGVDNPRKDPNVQAKIRQTHLTRYGVDNPMKNVDIRAKALATFKQRTGFNHPLQDPSIKALRRVQYLSQTGRELVTKVTNYLQTNGIKAKDVGLSRNWKRQSDAVILAVVQQFI